jgi:hypothetical protein
LHVKKIYRNGILPRRSWLEPTPAEIAADSAIAAPAATAGLAAKAGNHPHKGLHYR